MFDFGCSFSLVTAKGPTENAKGSDIDLNTDSLSFGVTRTGNDGGL